MTPGQLKIAAIALALLSLALLAVAVQFVLSGVKEAFGM